MTFSADFPIRAVESMTMRLDIKRSNLQNVAAMLVDDQDEAREMIADVLKDNGAQVREYANGEQAVAAFAAMPADQWPDVLICDLSLGDMDGYEVITRVRAMEAERGAALSVRLPAIALSGFAETESRLRTLLAGFQVHLAKPVNAQELLATVGALVPAASSRQRSSDPSY